jgi:dolichyl-phosphate beta-glucosyltransferase
MCGKIFEPVPCQVISATISPMIESGDNVYLSIIIPAFNEKKVISQTVQIVREYFTERNYKFELTVVDDGSSDSTSDLATKAGANVIRLEKNMGKGAAVRTGMLKASGEIILMTDADYPYEINQIEKFIPELQNGADIVIGSRKMPGSDSGRERLKRKIISRVGSYITRFLILPGISDTQAGFKCFKRDAARKIFSLATENGWGFDIEALYIARLHGLKIKEVPISLADRAILPSRIKKPIPTALKVFGSIFKFHWNRMTGKYRQSQSQ